MMKTVATLLTGAVFAAGLIVACSDDSPRPVDAATCDCPAAEPPIASRLARTRGVDAVLPANSVTTAVATCPAGATLVSGWCDFENVPGTPPQLALVRAGSSPVLPDTWTCIWQNYNSGSANVHAEAVCLMPPQ
jgi:hypothetical protein